MAAVRPRQVAQIGIIVRDLDRAKTFYRDLLGLTHLFDAPPGMSFFQCGEVRLMLSPPEGLDAPCISLVYYQVDDIDEAHRLLSAAGVAFDAAPHFLARLDGADLWLATCRDPDGNVVGLMSSKPAG